MTTGPASSPTSPRGRYRAAVRKAILAATIAGGVALGVGLFTFTYAKGGSYLTDDPAACANCHIMRDQYAGWLAGSHRAAAGCNDCHTPPGFVSKYLSKMENGWWHSFAFTTGRYSDPIQIREHNLAIANRACLNCHAGQFHETTQWYVDESKAVRCSHCHTGVGHGVRNSAGHFSMNFSNYIKTIQEEGRLLQ